MSALAVGWIGAGASLAILIAVHVFYWLDHRALVRRRDRD